NNNRINTVSTNDASATVNLCDYWKSPEAKSVFGLVQASPEQDMDDIRAAVKTRIQNLMAVYQASQGWRSIINDGDKLDLYSEHDVFSLRLKFTKHDESGTCSVTISQCFSNTDSDTLELVYENFDVTNNMFSADIQDGFGLLVEGSYTQDFAGWRLKNGSGNELGNVSGNLKVFNNRNLRG
ncbi:MAG: hypothetical protein SGBAC_006563, partial [Bacillariaceae sp.]